MSLRSRLHVLWVALVAACASGVATAHDARPVSVDIAEQSSQLYLARVRAPSSVEADDLPTLAWPATCRVVNRRLQNDPPAPHETTLVQCSGGLQGQRVGIRYPIYNPSLSTLFRLSEVGRRTVSQVLPPDEPDWLVPRELAWHEVAIGYLELGIEHIWKGIDHLLFVSGVLILARTRRRVILAITGFTLAHSLTLSASVLDLVHLPVPPVEAAIALSILFLAREIARPQAESIARRFPIAVSSTFGLLHGFGFAAALREAGLPVQDLAIGLLSFNVGVEIGQLVFIAALVALGFVLRRLTQSATWRPTPSHINTVAGYALGLPAAFWLLERLSLFT